MTNTVKRTWNSHKPLYNFKDPETGERRTVHKGETINVSAQTAQIFSNRLVDPDVAKAQKEASDAEKRAEQEAQNGGEKPAEAKASGTSSSASSGQAKQ